MHIDAAHRRQREHFFRQDAPVCRNDRKVGRKRFKIFERRAVAHRHRLKNGEILRQRIFLYRTWRYFVPIARLVRLRENAADLMPVSDQTLQDRARKVGRTHKDDPHSSSSSFSCSRRYFSSSSSLRILQCSV